METERQEYLCIELNIGQISFFSDNLLGALKLFISFIATITLGPEPHGVAVTIPAKEEAGDKRFKLMLS